MKVGVVGHGSIGKRHADNLVVLGHEVVIYDPVSRRDVKFERMIYDTCEAVVIATPSTHHEAGLRACVERGRHVLIEKPLSTSRGMLPLLLDEADEKQIVVMMGNNLRFHPCVQQAREWITEGKIGTPLWAHFTCAQETEKPLYRSDGVILNTGAHEVDMALHLLGSASVVAANARYIEKSGSVFMEDIADFMLVHDNGCRSTFHLDFVTTNPIREAWIVGTAERIGMDLIGRTISLGNAARGRPGTFDGDYFTEIETFFKRINHEFAPHGASGYAGLQTLDVLLDVRKKAGLP